MGNSNFTVSSSSFTVEGTTKGADITIYDCTVSDAIDCFGEDIVLEEIGKQKVMKYFDLQEKE